MCCAKSIEEQNAMREEIILNSASSLQNLAGEMGLFKTSRRNIRVCFEHLSERENANLQDRVTKYYKACGCAQGRVTGIITLLGFVLLLATGVLSVRELGVPKTLLYYFLCSFVTMLVAKIIGIWQARKQLMKLATEFQTNPH